MKLSRLATLALMGIVAGAHATQVEFAQNELLVKMKPGFSLDLANQGISATTISVMPEIGWAKVRLPSSIRAGQATQYYRSLGAVQGTSYNFVRRAALTPNDARYGEQYAPQIMGVPSAWDLTIGNSGVVIAIVDSGVDYTHPDLAGKVILGRDWVNNDSDPMDDDAHGTHCAGIAAAATNNGVGIAGIGYNSRILAIKVLSAQGSGSVDGVIQGILEAANKRADVISLSLGGPGGSQAEEDAVNYAVARGSVVLAAAGNDNVSTRFYPAGFPSVIAVGSTDRNDQKSWFSNFGADWVDIAAPGSEILSTVPPAVTGREYEVFDGTSMACPAAAGVAALVIARAGQGNITNARVREILETNTVNVGSWVRTGRVNAAAAVAAAAPPAVNVSQVYGIAPRLGWTGQGGLAQALTNDSAFFSVNSRNMSYGNTAEFTAEIRVNPLDLGSLMRMRILVRANASASGASSMFFVRDWTRPAGDPNAFQMVRSVALPTSNTTLSAVLPAPQSRFIGDDNTVLLWMRGTVPLRVSRSGWILNVDSVSVETTERTAP